MPTADKLALEIANCGRWEEYYQKRHEYTMYDHFKARRHRLTTEYKELAARSAPASSPISPLLRQFLTDWLAWADGEQENIGVFIRGDGLCDSLVSWCHHVAEIEAPASKAALQDELSRAFSYRLYPFGKENFVEQGELCTMHLCDLRRTWVRRTIETGFPYRVPTDRERSVCRYTVP